MSGCGCEVEIKDREQSRVLIYLLLINAVMFVAELSVGLLADSTALVADSLDMLADASVYAIGLYAVGRSLLLKAKAASLSGLFQVALGLGVLVDITRRFLLGSEPESLFMMAMGLVALAANVICLLLIARHRHGEVHMRASWIFSANDVIANIGVILAGVLVYVLGTRLPDLAIGLVIAGVVIRGGIRIVRDAAAERRASLPPS